MKHRFHCFLWFISSLALVAGCTKEDNISSEKSRFKIETPQHFPVRHYNNLANPITYEGFDLGRKIFYDTRLSKDGTISCASCHAQEHAFADHNMNKSLGIFRRAGKRNSPAIINIAWQPTMMWDGGITHLELMPVAPFTDTLEMGMHMGDIVAFMRGDAQYPKMFKDAFGNHEITDKKLLLALAQFMSSLITANAKYDQSIQGKSTLTEMELKGQELFNLHCDRCHTAPLFSNHGYANNGIGSFSDDPGRSRVTLLPEDEGKFRIPSLRNVALTYPYMHDGRLRNLTDVIDFYSNAKPAHATIDPILKNGLNLNENEKLALLAFLHALSDFDFVSNPLFANPN